MKVVETLSLRLQQRPGLAVAVRLLAAADLPVSDLTEEHLADFFYACDEQGNAVAMIGVEFLGASALLRSLVVSEPWRGQGLGASLTMRAEEYARSKRARAIYLLTTTAESFFLRLGYAPASREGAPPEIRSSQEFSSICPASSAFLSKQL